jgi:hypothetical protein
MSMLKINQAVLLDDPNIEYEPLLRTETEDAIAQLEIGDCVKICAGGFRAHDHCTGERFWVQVTEIENDPVLKVTGRVTNDLIYTCYHGYLRGSVVSCGAAKIYDTERLIREERSQ